MSESWPVMFSDFLNRRTLDLYEAIFCHDPDYVSLNEEFSREAEQLIAGLGPEKLEFYQNYESVANLLKGRENELCYQQGLDDGVRLAYLIDRIRRGGNCR